MDESVEIATLDPGLPWAIKSFGHQYFFVALEPRRQYDDSDDDDVGPGETKVQLFRIDNSGTCAQMVQEIPAGLDSISCIDVAKDAADGEAYYMSMAAYLDRKHNYYCVIYRTDDDSDPSLLRFQRVLSFKTDPDSERRKSCVRFDCSARTERGTPKRLITATGNSIRVWDFPELLRRASRNGGSPLEFSAPLLDIAAPHLVDDVQLSPCGSIIAATSPEYDAGITPLTFWDATSGQRVYTMEMNEVPLEGVGLRFLPATSEHSVRFIFAFTNPSFSASHASVVTIGEVNKRTHACLMVKNALFPGEEIRSMCVNADGSLVAVSSSEYHNDRNYLRVLDASLRCVFLEDVPASEARSQIDFVQRETRSDPQAELLSISNERERGFEDDTSLNRIRHRQIPLPPQERRQIPLPSQQRRIHEFFTPTNITLFVIFAVGVWLSYLFR